MKVSKFLSATGSVCGIMSDKVQEITASGMNLPVYHFLSNKWNLCCNVKETT